MPESTITYFNPEKVTIGENVVVNDDGRERPMTMKDYESIIADKPRDSEGRIRALASKFVDGVPVGQWAFEGTRPDDPNDRVDHEHRREIRGMRVLSSWLNDTDRRDANTMAVYTDEGYIKHYVQDFGNTLGANGPGIHEPIYGQAYLIDPRYMALNAITFGILVNPWETINAEEYIPYPSVGYFRSDVFKPGRWVSAHPLPAYENMTLRDAFWGAKQVMSFTDENIRAIVETGDLSSQKAEEYLIKTLIERRDKIGKYWFRKINPIDKFKVERNEDKIILEFTDLGTEKGLFEKKSTKYRYSLKSKGGQVFAENEETGSTRFTHTVSAPAADEPRVLIYEIVTFRDGVETEERKVTVYAVEDQNGLRIGGIQRQG
ncbi:MAG: hypothetical protein U5K72_16995 [Balneolaceae bacterium]|nr:hypothetical protein [Balneolaceae bacterium]